MRRPACDDHGVWRGWRSAESLCAAVALTLLAGCSEAPPSAAELPRVDVSSFGAAAQALLGERLEAARSQGQDAEAQGSAAMALHAYELREAAADLYARAAALAPKEYRWRYLHGLVLRELGRLARAEEAFVSAVAADPGSEAARLRLASTVLESGRAEEALELYARLAAQRPDSMAAHYGSGRALASLGRFEPAVAALERAASLASGYGPLYYELALALRNTGREEEAQHFLRLYERHGPSRRPPFVDSLLRQVEELREGSYLHHLNLGMRAEAAGRLEEALEQYELARAADPKQPHALVNSIGVLARLERPELAKQAYRDTLELNPDLEEAHYNYGVLLTRLGRFAEAEAVYRKAVEINPYSAGARVNLGDALEAQGQAGRAAAEYAKALEANPEHRLANFRLGTLLFRQGRRQEAVEKLRRTAAPEDEQTTEFLIVLARAERALGREEDARLHASAARRLAQRYGQSQALAILDREFVPGTR